jgi:hypothetical protein
MCWSVRVWPAKEKGSFCWFPKDERPKGEKGSFQMAGGPWLSGSGRAKAKDPGGTAAAWVSRPKELGF